MMITISADIQTYQQNVMKVLKVKVSFGNYINNMLLYHAYELCNIMSQLLIK